MLLGYVLVGCLLSAEAPGCSFDQVRIGVRMITPRLIPSRSHSRLGRVNCIFEVIVAT